jgi:hypothetical protein
MDHQCDLAHRTLANAGFPVSCIIRDNQPPTFVSEEECSVCGKWPEKDRWAVRAILDRIPMDGVCIKCELQFWRNLGLDKLLGAQPTKH